MISHHRAVILWKRGAYLMLRPRVLGAHVEFGTASFFYGWCIGDTGMVITIPCHTIAYDTTSLMTHGMTLPVPRPFPLTNVTHQ